MCRPGLEAGSAGLEMASAKPRHAGFAMKSIYFPDLYRMLCRKKILYRIFCTEQNDQNNLNTSMNSTAWSSVQLPHEIDSGGNSDATHAMSQIF